MFQLIYWDQPHYCSIYRMHLIFEALHFFLDGSIAKDLLLKSNERVIVTLVAQSFLKTLVCYQTFFELSYLPLKIIFKDFLDHRWQMLFYCFYLFLKIINFVSGLIARKSQLAKLGCMVVTNSFKNLNLNKIRVGWLTSLKVVSKFLQM